MSIFDSTLLPMGAGQFVTNGRYRVERRDMKGKLRWREKPGTLQIYSGLVE
jgi:hypothetical protein